MKKWTLLVFLVLTIQVPQQVQAQESLDRKLALVDGRGSDTLVVNRFRSLLGQLSTKFADTPERISDMSVMARNSLREKGVSESILNIMEGMNQVIDAPMRSSKGVNMQKYAEYVSLYIVQRNSGTSHADAVGNMRRLIVG